MRYSQNNEQDIILQYFGNRKGFFLDIGANDGITLSNTYALQLQEWKGVLIEPSEEAFNRIKASNGVQKFNVAIGTEDGHCTFHEMGNHLNAGDVSLLSTIKKTELKRWPGVEFKERMTEVWTYKTLLKHSRLKFFDFISIDAEGVDYEILEQIDLKYTDMVCIEHNSNPDLFQLIKDYCNKAGLTKKLLNNLENVIWAR
ncbi:MAG: FkbM family methyltransferase [Pseudomonadota bacterium]|jgi:FkbM family methyltransferase